MANSRLLVELPAEVLDHVFSYLSLYDRKSVSLVCRSWNELAFNPRFLKSINLRLGKSWDQSVVNCFRASRRRYRNLFISFRPESLSELKFALIVDILDQFGDELDYCRCNAVLTEEQLWNVIIRVPNVRELIVGVDETFLKHDRTFPLLRRSQDMGSTSHVLPKLLQLGANSTSFSQHPIGLIGAPTCYELFSVEFYFSIEELRFPMLETLNIKSWANFPENENALRLFFNSVKFLKDFRQDISVNDLMLAVLTQTCSEMESLHVKLQYPKSHTFHCLERLKKLKTLSISASIDHQITLTGKPLESVKRVLLELTMKNDELKIFNGFRQWLPNVDDISILSGRNGILQYICENYLQLRRLSMTDLGMHPTINFQHLDQLEELTLKWIFVSPRFMPNIKCLKRLNLKSPVWLGDTELMKLPGVYPNLKHLELYCCDDVTSAGVDDFLFRLPNCVVNRVTKCPMNHDR